MVKDPQKTVLVFGAFDPLHAGHVDFFRQARWLGERLVVVVARDESIRVLKGREPFWEEEHRLAAVSQIAEVNEARLGLPPQKRMEVLRLLDFDVVALGYDQKPGIEAIRAELARIGKAATVVRLEPFLPELYKSSLVRARLTV